MNHSHSTTRSAQYHHTLTQTRPRPVDNTQLCERGCERGWWWEHLTLATTRKEESGLRLCSIITFTRTWPAWRQLQVLAQQVHSTEVSLQGDSSHLNSFKVQAPPSECLRDRGVVVIDVQGQGAIIGRCEMLQRGERMVVRGRGGDWGVCSLITSVTTVTWNAGPCTTWPMVGDVMRTVCMCVCGSSS